MTYEDLRKANELIQTMSFERYNKKQGKMVSKEYAEVNQRIKAFRSVFPDGFILTDIESLKDGVCLMTARVGYYDDGNTVILGMGHAYEKEGASDINKTSYIENCVPLDTEILTKDGWKYYYQVAEGDEVLSLNLTSQKVEFCKVTAINVYRNHPVCELSTTRFLARCTPEHKWVVRSQYEGLHKVATKDIKVSEKIVQNVPQEYNASDDGRRLGWLMCDCEISRTENGMPSTAYIRQSKHVGDVGSLFGEGRLCKKYNEKWMDSYEWNVPAEEVRRVLGKFKVSNYADLSRAMLVADIDDVAGCYQSVMLADGENRGFSSTYYELVQAVQIMCARLGIATGHITSRVMRNSTKPLYTLSIKMTDGARASEIWVKNLPPQDVWCPTTENGTWFMRQGDFVTLTSNCETSAVGRALGMCGFGIDTSVASYEEIKGAMEQQDASAEEPEDDAKKIAEEKVDNTKAQALAVLIADVGANIDDILKAYKVESLADMKMKQWKDCMDILSKRKDGKGHTEKS